MPSISRTWGTEPQERQRAYPCDGLVPDGAEALWRGVTVHAPPAVLFRWLCQMRVAPYSYDWLDNFGRRSPRQRTPGLEALEAGQTFMTIFELVRFARDEHLTLRLRPGSRAVSIFGELAVSYCIVPRDEQSCRLLVKLLVRAPAGLYGKLARALLPWGDLIMMRRQLLNLRRLAEQDARPA